MDEANKLIREKKYKEAIPLLRKFLWSADSDFGLRLTALVNLACCYTQNDMYSRTLETLNQAAFEISTYTGYPIGPLIKAYYAYQWAIYYYYMADRTNCQFWLDECEKMCYSAGGDKNLIECAEATKKAIWETDYEKIRIGLDFTFYQI